MAKQTYQPRHAAWLREQPAVIPHEVWHQQLRETFPAAFGDAGPVLFDLDRWLAEDAAA